MVKFLVLREYQDCLQEKLDEWSEEHPDVCMDDVECSYTIDENGMWNLILVYEDN